MRDFLTYQDIIDLTETLNSQQRKQLMNSISQFAKQIVGEEIEGISAQGVIKFL